MENILKTRPNSFVDKMRYETKYIEYLEKKNEKARQSEDKIFGTPKLIYDYEKNSF